MASPIKINMSPVMVVTQSGTKRIKAWNLIIQNAGTLSCTLNNGWTLAPGYVLNLGHDDPRFLIDDTFSFIFASGAGTARIEIIELNPAMPAHNQ